MLSHGRTYSFSDGFQNTLFSSAISIEHVGGHCLCVRGVVVCVMLRKALLLLLAMAGLLVRPWVQRDAPLARPLVWPGAQRAVALAVRRSAIAATEEAGRAGRLTRWPVFKQCNAATQSIGMLVMNTNRQFLGRLVFNCAIQWHVGMLAELQTKMTAGSLARWGLPVGMLSAGMLSGCTLEYSGLVLTYLMYNSYFVGV